jgi:hypothetical protein
LENRLWGNGLDTELLRAEVMRLARESGARWIEGCLPYVKAAHGWPGSGASWWSLAPSTARNKLLQAAADLKLMQPIEGTLRSTTLAESVVSLATNSISKICGTWLQRLSTRSQRKANEALPAASEVAGASATAALTAPHTQSQQVLPAPATSATLALPPADAAKVQRETGTISQGDSPQRYVPLESTSVAQMLLARTRQQAQTAAAEPEIQAAFAQR